MEINSAISRSNFTYIAEVYSKYIKNPSSVDASWKGFFEGLSEDEKTLISDLNGSGWETSKSAVIGERNELSSLPVSEVLEVLTKEEADKKKKKEAIAIAMKEGLSSGNAEAELEKVLINYREFGHLSATLDPIGLQPTTTMPDFKGEASKEVSVLGFKAKVSEVLNHFKSTYCGKLGAEIHHIKNAEERAWLYDKMENFNFPANASEIQKEALNNLIKAEAFENSLHLKFPGAKRFSIEGGEVTIVALENILLTASENGVSNVIMGMAHRGRLNILTHVLGKPYMAIFSEFMGVSSIPEGVPGSGDVKYHLGFTNKRKLSNGKEVKVSLTPNPSHLEAVNSVVTGRVRARQDIMKDTSRSKVMGILIHGDASMAGQGVVAESLAMSGLEGYKTGGTVHIVINNQVGFTALQKDTKSSTYSTDVAKMIDAPIFHVNGNSIESVIKASIIIAEYRQKFGKDAVLEIVCYRKYGHNEGDEPMFTQPVMYTKIKSMGSPSAIYSKELGLEDFAEKTRNEINAFLDQEFEKAKTYKPTKADWLEGRWKKVKRLSEAKELFAFEDTKITEREFDMVGGTISLPPEKFKLNAKVKKMLDDRKMSLLAGDKIDWATAELLAYGTLMMEGYPVRLSGEDCERGTFSHRHSVYYDQETNAKYEPLNNIKTEKLERYEVINSLLSEFAVLGYEYGYSIENPDVLTIWEAQFGDFSNGAVTIYDQFISSGEDKWLKMSGLVSLLPHGFEGQGPEHSSARLERFLQYCAENNIIVCNITTPANLFHALRRQVKMPFRKPMVIMSPKSLLRHKLVVSNMKEFTSGKFKPIILEETNKKTAKKIIFTSGKIFYEAFEEREKLGKQSEIAIVRIEQYYPFDTETLKKELVDFKSAKEFVWLQEEPKNMGAWNFVRDYLEEVCGKVSYVGRVAKPSPATGFASVHAKEQKAIIEEALK